MHFTKEDWIFAARLTVLCGSVAFFCGLLGAYAGNRVWPYEFPCYGLERGR